jgi:hypothetical protein
MPLGSSYLEPAAAAAEEDQVDESVIVASADTLSIFSLVADIKAALAVRGLSRQGNKHVLLARLQKALAAATGSALAAEAESAVGDGEDAQLTEPAPKKARRAASASKMSALLEPAVNGGSYARSSSSGSNSSNSSNISDSADPPALASLASNVSADDVKAARDERRAEASRAAKAREAAKLSAAARAVEAERRQIEAEAAAAFNVGGDATVGACDATATLGIPMAANRKDLAPGWGLGVSLLLRRERSVYLPLFRCVHILKDRRR